MIIDITFKKVIVLFTLKDKKELEEMGNIIKKNNSWFKKCEFAIMFNHLPHTHALVFTLQDGIPRSDLMLLRRETIKKVLKRTNDNLKIIKELCYHMGFAAAKLAYIILFKHLSSKQKTSLGKKTEIAALINELFRRLEEKDGVPVTQSGFLARCDQIANEIALQKNYAIAKYIYEACLQIYQKANDPDTNTVNWDIADFYIKIYLCSLRGRLDKISQLMEFNTKAMQHLAKCKPSETLKADILKRVIGERVEVGKLLKAGNLEDCFVTKQVDIKKLVKTRNFLLIKETLATFNNTTYCEQIANELLRLINELTPENSVTHQKMCDALVEGTVISGPANAAKVKSLIEPQYLSGKRDLQYTVSQRLSVPDRAYLLLERLGKVIEKLSGKAMLALEKPKYNIPTFKLKVVGKKLKKSTSTPKDTNKDTNKDTKKEDDAPPAAKTGPANNLHQYSMDVIDTLQNEIKQNIHSLISKEKRAQNIINELKQKNPDCTFKDRAWNVYIEKSSQKQELFREKEDVLVSRAFNSIMAQVELDTQIKLQELRDTYSALSEEFTEEEFENYKQDRVEVISKLSHCNMKLKKQLDILDQMIEHPPIPIAQQTTHKLWNQIDDRLSQLTTKKRRVLGIIKLIETDNPGCTFNDHTWITYLKNISREHDKSYNEKGVFTISTDSLTCLVAKVESSAQVKLQELHDLFENFKKKPIESNRNYESEREKLISKLSEYNDWLKKQLDELDKLIEHPPKPIVAKPLIPSKKQDETALKSASKEAQGNNDTKSSDADSKKKTNKDTLDQPAQSPSKPESVTDKAIKVEIQSTFTGEIIDPSRILDSRNFDQKSTEKNAMTSDVTSTLALQPKQPAKNDAAPNPSNTDKALTIQLNIEAKSDSALNDVDALLANINDALNNELPECLQFLNEDDENDVEEEVVAPSKNLSEFTRSSRWKLKDILGSEDTSFSIPHRRTIAEFVPTVANPTPLIADIDDSPLPRLSL